MKTIGLIGGMSWESTIPYYRIINETVRERLGGLHSAKVFLYSVDFHEIERLQHEGNWDGAGEVLAGAACSLQNAGADFIALCTNTMHKVAERIQDATDVPFLHIADPTAEEVKRSGFCTVGLLGTRFTMEQDFYKGRLLDRHGIEVIIPHEEDRELVHRVIFEELCLGQVLEGSHLEFRRIIGDLADRGAQGVILGCTEIQMLVSQRDSDVRIFDTTAIHARGAAEWALAGC
ncbi:MAG: aspartate/glutamate racemase family protein [Syntrophaceae bacterium]|nr:aspartate/glutamate racemase family protein [Syntrophaceae bacterium]